MRFTPPRCPYEDCSAHAPGVAFPWRRKGTYARKCDGRNVQRFLCLTCNRGFSTQTFRLDHRLRRLDASSKLFVHFCSKVTMRQSARTLGISRKTVAHRHRLLGEHFEHFHQLVLLEAERRGGLSGSFQLDELETYETDRRLQPVTVPVLIEKTSFFVLHAETAPLPCRGGLSPRLLEKKCERERLFGKRRSGSRAAVKRTFEVLARTAHPRDPVPVRTDRKESYSKVLHDLFGARVRHVRIDSTLPRGRTNPLFQINHTLAMLRDGISRLVRRTWAASKLRNRLDSHLWTWIAWRNYLRGITVNAPRTTPAMVAGVLGRQLTRTEILRWKALYALELLGLVRRSAPHWRSGRTSVAGAV